ncbi:hypothetical protein CSM15_004578 [Salmonella enterica subsp. diarizonae]|nr:hypothetical protein [Salmonella enterica subsp. diarizonae]
MVKSLSVMGITDSDFPMSSIIGRANLLLTTSIGGGVHVGIKYFYIKIASNIIIFPSSIFFTFAITKNTSRIVHNHDTYHNKNRLPST